MYPKQPTNEIASLCKDNHASAPCPGERADAQCDKIANKPKSFAQKAAKAAKDASDAQVEAGAAAARLVQKQLAEKARSAARQRRPRPRASNNWWIRSSRSCARASWWCTRRDRDCCPPRPLLPTHVRGEAGRGRGEGPHRGRKECSAKSRQLGTCGHRGPTGPGRAAAGGGRGQGAIGAPPASGGGGTG